MTTTASTPDRPGLITRPSRDGGAAVLVAEQELLAGQDVQHAVRLHEVLERRADRFRVDGAADHLAVDAEDEQLTYDDLDRRANALAHHLRRHGSRAGDRIALLLDRPIDTYVAMLAVSKMHATFVPLDVGFPADRIAYIVDDAAVSTVLTGRSAVQGVSGFDPGAATLRYLDDEAADITAQVGDRLGEADDDLGTELAYIVYTSGSTGRPKGVAVEQRSIANFIQVAGEVYGLDSTDRVYQGMTTAFDFSSEEIWVPWAAGATVVPKPAGETLLGADLSEHLVRRGITALCCVPTLLATLEEDLPQLRFLLVSGEACPQDLVTRWHRPDRRFLNVYGPTEATVTATWTALRPDRPITIGVPLPTYAVVLLDPEDPEHALPRGEVGEIAIAGVGLAREYVNRAEKTREVFVPDGLDLHQVVGNPSGRIYRTGDLGRITETGEIEYRGRIDLQVKIRGYRIELTEIESVMLEVTGVAAAVVDTHEPSLGAPELVGYYTVRADSDVDEAALLDRLRADLPPYMVPAHLERLDAIPLTTNDKADRANLPAPSGPRAGGGGEHVDPATDTEGRLADTLAATLGVEHVSVTANLFDQLGVTSLLVASFTARLRRAPEPVSLSVKDIYQHPTVRELACVIESQDDGADVVVAPATEHDRTPRTSSLGYALFAVAQVLLLLAGAAVLGLVASVGDDWLTTAASFSSVVARGAVFSAAVLAGLCLLPIVAKWLLVRRWTPREIPLWSLGHLRFWLVKTLIRLDPLVLFVGTPVYTAYLRALGARIGTNVLVLSRIVPVATDLVAIGDDTVIRPLARFNGYRAVPGRLQLGAVTLGAGVLVGEQTVLDIDTRMHDGATLGHSSALHPGTEIPAGDSRHGSPAEPTTTDYRTVPGGHCGRLRRTVFGTTLLLAAVGIAGVGLTAGEWVLTRLSDWVDLVVGASSWPRIVPAAAVVAATAGAMLLALRMAAAIVVPRLLAPLVRPGRVHPLYGVAHLAQIVVTLTANSRFLVLLLGDSSFVTGYLASLGYRLRPLEQTGSNFGTQVSHDAPGVTRVGTGTMISDGLRVMNADWSSAGFQVSPVSVGARNFLGNDVAFPTGAHVGDNVLIATKALVPVDGPVRHDVGLLGSPAFEIPRSSGRTVAPDVRLRRAKARHNTLSMTALLLARTVQLGVGVAIGLVTARAENTDGGWVYAAATVAIALVTVVSTVLFERMAPGRRDLYPHEGSIYDPMFWRHERLWKFYANPLLAGTAVQNLLRRLSGVRGGHRVFDDGCIIPEKRLVTVGDDAVLNEGAVVQCHSLEDGRFTRDRSGVGAGAVLGVGAFVHLGTNVGERSVLAADSFLMKGEQVPSDAVWAGNPAAPSRELRDPRATVARAAQPPVRASATTSASQQPIPPGPPRSDAAHTSDTSSAAD